MGYKRLGSRKDLLKRLYILKHSLRLRINDARLIDEVIEEISKLRKNIKRELIKSIPPDNKRVQ